MGLLWTLRWCTVLPVNSLWAMRHLAEIHLGWGWLHNSKRRGRAARANGSAAARLGQQAGPLNADFIAQPFCLPLKGDTLAASCVTSPYCDSRSWQVESTYTSHTKRNTCFFPPLRVCLTGCQQSQRSKVTSATAGDSHHLGWEESGREGCSDILCTGRHLILRLCRSQSETGKRSWGTGCQVDPDNNGKAWQRSGERRGSRSDISFWSRANRQTPTGQRLERLLKIATGGGKTILKGNWDSWGSTLHSGERMRMGSNEITLSDREGRRRRKRLAEQGA